jgi:hypothetical protein
MVRAGSLGVLGLGVTFAWMLKDPRVALYSYLVAFAYWAGVALASLVLLMLFHTFHAKWPTVLRRPLEAIAASLGVFVLLFVPIALGMDHIYPWVSPPSGLTGEEQHLLHHKAPYLNVPFFLARTLVYWLVTMFIGQRLFGWSTRQDDSGDIALTVRQRRFSTGGLPVMAVVLAFASFDWLMSLNPFWFSTIFGVYYFAGGILTALSVLVLVTIRARGQGLYGSYVTPEHTHNIGKLMLAFTVFWAYIGFSQFMLIWIANLPEEVPFFTVRMNPAWSPVSIFLIVGHFAIPFFALLSKELKRRPRALGVVAVWLIFMNFVDLYWLVFPSFSPGGWTLHFTLVTAGVGVGGIAVAAVLWRIRGHYTMPVKDPFLAVSMRYEQP